MGRKAFGPSKKKASDFKKCLKKKQPHEPREKAEKSGLKHPRAF
ncbi:MAG: hypothetical protein Q8L26_04495 [Candidatus Omnitrophota bacterium]|nr:hypothetical protein [Candidatus Omnitrophota bacterium]